MQFFILLISYFSCCVIGTLLLYCYANAVIRMGRNLPGELKCALKRAAALEAFLVFVIIVIIISDRLSSCVNHISNHIILSLDIIFFFSLLVLILFHKIKQAGFTFGMALPKK